jgi:putative transposase
VQLTALTNAYCERLMGTIRRECLDYVIPSSEKHLRTISRNWVAHYNQGRPHSSLGPGIPDLGGKPIRSPSAQRHELPAACRIRVKMFSAGCTMNTGWKKIAA